MCLGWEPRMHNAPVKNEEAFIPIAFHVTSTLIITTCFFFFFFHKATWVWTQYCWSYLWAAIWVDFAVSCEMDWPVSPVPKCGLPPLLDENGEVSLSESSARAVFAKREKYALSLCVPSERQVAVDEIGRAVVRKTCDASTFFLLQRPHCNIHWYGNTPRHIPPAPRFSKIIKTALTGDRPRSSTLKDERRK